MRHTAWLLEWMNAFIHEWMNEYMNKGMNEWMNDSYTTVSTTLEVFGEITIESLGLHYS